MKKKDAPVTTSSNSGKYDAQSNDPFAEFEKVATISNVDNNNQFGEFDDFGTYDFGKKSEVVINEKKDSSFGFDNNQSNEIKAENFQTNNFSNFEQNFHNNDLSKLIISLVSADNFTTNNYGNYNNFLDLLDSTSGTSDTYGKPVETKKKTLLEEITPDISGKQMINRTLMTAVEIKKSAVQTATDLKNKAMNKFDSLI